MSACVHNVNTQNSSNLPFPDGQIKVAEIHAGISEKMKLELHRTIKERKKNKKPPLFNAEKLYPHSGNNFKFIEERKKKTKITLPFASLPLPIHDRP